jgi:hypothetical protein
LLFKIWGHEALVKKSSTRGIEIQNKNMTNYEVEILVNRKPIRQYNYAIGNSAQTNSTCIEGRKGSTFVLKFKNNGPIRALFSTTIDGLSIISGEKSVPNNRSGYVVEPFSSIMIDGWRLSNDEVAEFYFSSVDDSYATRTKAIQHEIGQIDVAVFENVDLEAIVSKSSITYVGDDIRLKGGNWTDSTPDWSYMSASSIETSFIPQNAMLCSLRQDVGTGFGATKESKVQDVHLIWETYAAATFLIHYNSRDALMKLGINMNSKQNTINRSGSGFCKRPER